MFYCKFCEDTDYNTSHCLTGIQPIASMVPKWMPLGGDFWAIFTGIAFVLAGLAIILQVLDVLATRLLALMLFIFGVIALLPLIFASPNDHISWGANAYSLTAMAAAWIMADWLAAYRKRSADYTARSLFVNLV